RSNWIFLNFGYGIVVADSSVGTTIRGNTIYNNGYIGIDLIAATDVFPDVTLNDPNDSDPGPNHLQNFPVFTSAALSGNVTILSGTSNTPPNRTFILDFYRNAATDPTGYGEGQFYLGGKSVSTDASGNAVFGFGVPGNFTGQYFTATATDTSTGDTS